MLQFMDDFTCYGTDSGRFGRMSNGTYAEAVGGSGGGDLVVDPDPTAGGARVLSMLGNANSSVRKVLSSAQTTVGVAFRSWLSGIPAASNNALVLTAFRDQNNVQHGFLTVDASGFLKYYRSDNGVDVLLAISAAPVRVAAAWQHMETRVLFDAAAGNVEVRIEGYQVLYVAGVRTTTNVVGAIASCFNVAFKNTYFQGPTMYFKDLIIWDGSGAVNNTWFGTCQVYKIVPDGDVSLNWTPSTGATGYNLINDSNPDDDTGYISAPTPAPAAAKFSMTDLPVNTTVVRGVMAYQRTRKSDAGDGNVQVGLISASSTGLGSDRPVTTAYTYYYDCFDLDPNGNINWSKASVNALNTQLNRTL